MLDRSWFERDAPIVAPELLGKLLIAEMNGDICTGRIVETEAYMPDDPASHTFNGETRRNAVMFGPAGHLYVYLSYGIHHCANVVTGPEGSGQAVLLRAVEPIHGIDTMVARRGRSGRDLTNGPGKLCQAFGIRAVHDGADLLDGPAQAVCVGSTVDTVSIVDDGVPRPTHPLAGARVGITKAVDVLWRFRIPSAS